MGFFATILAGYLGFSVIAGIFAVCICAAARHGDRVLARDEMAGSEQEQPSGATYSLRPQIANVRQGEARRALRQF